MILILMIWKDYVKGPDSRFHIHLAFKAALGDLKLIRTEEHKSKSRDYYYQRESQAVYKITIVEYDSITSAHEAVLNGIKSLTL